MFQLLDHRAQLSCIFVIVKTCLQLKIECTPDFLIDIINILFIVNR